MKQSTHRKTILLFFVILIGIIVGIHFISRYKVIPDNIYREVATGIGVTIFAVLFTNYYESEQESAKKTEQRLSNIEAMGRDGSRSDLLFEEKARKLEQIIIANRERLLNIEYKLESYQSIESTNKIEIRELNEAITELKIVIASWKIYCKKTQEEN